MKTHRYILFIIACILSIGTGWAGGTNSYTIKATASGDTPYGSVYASFENSAPGTTSPDWKRNGQESSSTQSIGSFLGYSSFNVYLFAKPDKDYTLEKWEQTIDNKTKTLGAAQQQNGTFSLTDNLQLSGNKTISYTAYFKQLGDIRVHSGKGGAVTISKVDNTAGNNITIKAYNLYDYVFDGWYKGSDETATEKTSYTQEQSLTVSSGNKGDYIAKFIQNTDATYYRIHNSNGKYLCFEGNQSSQVTQKGSDGRSYFAGTKLQGTIKLTEDKGLGTILKVTHNTDITDGHKYTGVSIEGQGIKLEEVLAKYDEIEGLCLLWDNTDGYTICDNNQTYSLQSVGSEDCGYFVAQAYSGVNGDKWYFEPVNEIPISADIDATREGETKYYTTLYTSFPYSCQKGVKPYIVNEVAEETGVVGISTLDGQVPAFTPVILECSSNTPANNIIKPLNTNVGSVTGNKLMGTINLYTNSNQPTTLQTVAYGENTRIIKKYTATTPAVVTFSHPSESGYVASNTCYLESDLAENQLISTLYDPTLDVYGASGRVQENATGNDFADYCKTNKNAMALMDEIYECVAGSVPNVIVKHNNNTYDCENFVLTDKVDWGSPVSFTAKNGSYERSNVGGLNSVCMPFAISTSDLPEGSTIYTLNSIDTEKDEADFSAVSSVAAGTPCLIQCADDAALWDFLLSNASVTHEIASVAMQGSYTKKTLGTGYWKVNSDGTKLTNTTASSTITPFRSYVAVPEGMPAKALKIIFTTPTGIKNYDKVLTNDAAFYGIDGRETKTLRKGINIVRNADGSTRKILK